MSEHDQRDGGDGHALLAVDRRGRAAAAAIHAAVAARVEGPTPGVAPSTARGGDASGGGHVIDLVRRDPAAGGHRRGRPPSGWGAAWLAVAAALVAVAAAVSVLVLPAERTPTMSSGGQGQLVLGWTPWGGYHAPMSVVDTIGPVPAQGEVAVYGDARADDPWAGPLVTVTGSDRPPPGAPTPAEPPLGGQPVNTVVDIQTVGLAWAADRGSLEVTVRGGGLGPSDARRAAESTTGGAAPAIAAAGLPTGLTEIARGPLGATLADLSPADPGTFAAAYGREGTRVAIYQRPGVAGDVDLARLLHPSVRPVEVRGRHAVEGPVGDPPVAASQRFVQWWEPSGLLTTVFSYGWTQEQLLRAADELRPATARELLDLRSGTNPARAVMPNGALTLASGVHDGVPWRLSVMDDARGLRFRFRASSAAMRADTGVHPVKSADTWLTAPFQLPGWGDEAVFGLVSTDMTALDVEVEGRRSPVRLTPVSLRGGAVLAYVTFVPTTRSFTDGPGDDAWAVLIAHSPSGETPLPVDRRPQSMS